MESCTFFEISEILLDYIRHSFIGYVTDSQAAVMKCLSNSHCALRATKDKLFN